MCHWNLKSLSCSDRTTPLAAGEDDRRPGRGGRPCQLHGQAAFHEGEEKAWSPAAPAWGFLLVGALPAQAASEVLSSSTALHGCTFLMGDLGPKMHSRFFFNWP